MIASRLLVVSLLAASPLVARAQEGYKVEALKSAAPDGYAPAIKAALAGEGVRVLNPEGKPFAEIWLRKDIPATAKPSGSKGAIQFPILSEGEFLGVLKFVAEGHDYRDQAIPPGLYTLRYGLQPINGDHLGVSPYRDYALLVPAAKDASLDRLDAKKLATRSAEAAGSSHPSVLLMVTPPSDVKAAPAVARDEEKNTWGAVLGLPLAVPGEAGTTPLLVQIVVEGAAM